jgi:hypothetical protein
MYDTAGIVPTIELQTQAVGEPAVGLSMPFSATHFTAGGAIWCPAARTFPERPRHYSQCLTLLVTKNYHRGMSCSISEPEPSDLQTFAWISTSPFAGRVTQFTCGWFSSNANRCKCHKPRWPDGCGEALLRMTRAIEEQLVMGHEWQLLLISASIQGNSHRTALYSLAILNL